ncbi:hypothetical protein C6A47_21500 [Escherichia coli]|nr:hypothetical protein [Escherichia coli]OYI25107.1 hypothetical protein CI700_08740 [Shigella sonnei]EFB2488564.1 hypothetical protein [Escherichia coli]EFB9599109.1 hypothetical protein [Escherichia coli]EFB9716000.1 hypothetical protein [Escherichia coli]
MTLQAPCQRESAKLYQNKTKEKNRKSRIISQNNNKIRHNKPNSAPKSRIRCQKATKKIINFFFMNLVVSGSPEPY